jgi:hypothetical protein
MEIMLDRRAALERLQNELELKKLAIERAKTKWTAISIAVRLLAAVITVIHGLRSMEKQAEMNLQFEAAKDACPAPGWPRSCWPIQAPRSGKGDRAATGSRRPEAA